MQTNLKSDSETANSLKEEGKKKSVTQKREEERIWEKVQAGGRTRSREMSKTRKEVKPDPERREKRTESSSFDNLKKL